MDTNIYLEDSVQISAPICAKVVKKISTDHFNQVLKNANFIFSKTRMKLQWQKQNNHYYWSYQKEWEKMKRIGDRVKLLLRDLKNEALRVYKLKTMASNLTEAAINEAFPSSESLQKYEAWEEDEKEAELQKGLNCGPFHSNGCPFIYIFYWKFSSKLKLPFLFFYYYY